MEEFKAKIGFIKNKTFEKWLEIEKDKKIIAITGPNGSGKSYFLKTFLKKRQQFIQAKKMK